MLISRKLVITIRTASNSLLETIIVGSVEEQILHNFI